MAHSAFLLAAGFGTRLRPLTLHRPKPLVPVCGVPMLDYALALVRRHRIRPVVVNAHHLAAQIVDWARAQDPPVQVSIEQPEIQGTGGGLRDAAPLLGDRIVVVNGDILCDVDLAGLLDGLQGGVDAVMALRRLERGEPYGVVAADAEGVVVDLIGKATAPPRGPVDRGTHFTGVHALHRRALDPLPAQGPACIVRQSYITLVPDRRIGARLHEGTWFDVGTPAAYLRANQLAVAGELALPLDPFERAGYGVLGGREYGDSSKVFMGYGARVIPPVWIGQGAVLESGCQVGPGSVIGRGAVIGRDAVVSASVVWEDCPVAAGAAIRNAIVYDGGVLTPGQPIPPDEVGVHGGH
ncbi:MAG: NDP-sugar synthase [Alphaproteobacteria bacterium]|nr:NDP-sugar synthase [Alphaproteobacteria bacterium]